MTAHKWTRRRIVIVGLAVLATGLVVVSTIVRPSRPSEDGSTTFVDARSQISLRLPEDWRAQRFDGYCRRGGPGAIVANVQGRMFRRVETPRGCTSQLRLDTFPSNLVAVEAGRFGRPPGRPDQPVTRLPLSLARMPQFRIAQRSGWHGVVRPQLVYVGDGAYYVVRVYLGDRASPAARLAAAQIVSSLRFGR